MSTGKERKNRLKWQEDSGILPFDLDFLRELGFEFGEDWDGEIIIECPEKINIEDFIKLIKRFAKGIKTRLYFEGQKAKRICVGGPMNGKPHFKVGIPNEPILFHLKRGEWAVYSIKSYDDPRAWYVGLATSKKKARELI
jgi:hypothetical protein